MLLLLSTCPEKKEQETEEAEEQSPFKNTQKFTNIIKKLSAVSRTVTARRLLLVTAWGSGARSEPSSTEQARARC